MPEIYGNLHESETFTDFDYAALDEPQIDHDTTGAELISNWCSYVASDLRIEQMSLKAFALASVLGFPVNFDLCTASASEVLEVSQKINQLGFCSKDARSIMVPVMQWMIQGATYESAGHRNLVFVFRMEKSFMPFETYEDLGIWISVGKVRVQHLINEFHIALGLKYRSNKKGDQTRTGKTLQRQIERSRLALLAKLKLNGENSK